MKKIPLSTMRKAVAGITTQSFSTVPHFYLRTEVDATALIAKRKGLLENWDKDKDPKPTYTDLMLWATIKALNDCPRANRIWDGDCIHEFETVNLGFVVGLDDGLMIPVICEAEKLDIMDLVRKRYELTVATRAGKLPGSALLGATMSLTNIGLGCVDEFAPVIFPPQSCMLAAGRMKERAVVIDGELCVRPTIRLCLAADHRVFDGLQAGEFLNSIVEALENN